METLEYALIAGLIAIAAVLIFQPFGPTLRNKLNNATNASASASGAGGNQGGGNQGGGNQGSGNGNGGNK